MKKEFVAQSRAIQEYTSFSSSNRSHRFHRVLRLLFFSFVLLSTACSTLNKSSPSGIQTTQRSAFSTAALHSHTWQPLAAAALIAATGSDHSISDWAAEHTPVYGSQSTAQDASDFLRATLATTALATSVVAPGPESILMAEGAKNVALAATAAITSGKLTHALKDETGRTRPHGVGDQSFPSSHTSAASTYAAIATYRVNEFAISEGARKAWNFGFRALAAATGWARVEANSHYPTDVLVGYALGNFTAVWLHEIFLGPQSAIQLNFDLDHKSNAFKLNLTIPF